MSRYTADSKDRVLAAVDMLALISTRTDLRRAGVNSYFGICPFHDERTGSFHVRPDEKHYHCFGCQASGDPFEFVMETEGLDFKEAMESLADRFGVKLETEDEDPAAASRRQRRERLQELLGRAATYYAQCLWKSPEAQDARGYLLARGFTEETLGDFRVGYAPSAWDRILLASKRAGFTEEELLTVGLAQRSKSRPGSVFDRFRKRIMFPSADSRGRIVGFGARAMGEDQKPKYLNTSEGELYHKREQLFGIDRARGAAAKAGRMILVEGYTDVLALHQAGLRNSVGIMGTSLTEEQVRELERSVSILEFCLDADRAGQDAIMRASRLAAGSKLELRVVPLPEGTDPGELIEREGADALRACVEASVPFVVFQVERILGREDSGTVEGKDRALAELGPLLSELPPGVLHDELFRRVSGRLGISGNLAAHLAATRRPAPLVAGNGGGGDPGPEPAGLTGPTSALGDQAVRAERAFLVLCIALPAEGDAALAAIDPDALLTSGLYRRAARHLTGRARTPLTDLPSDDEDLARAVADLVARAGRAGSASAEQLEHARLILELARLDRAIRRARVEGGGDQGALARERERVREAIHEVTARLEGAV
jgi:DNA primase